MTTKRKIWAAPWLWIAVVAGVAIHVAALWLLRVRLDFPAPAAPRASPVAVVVPGRGSNSDAVLRERLELLDPAPLIAPTRWNSGAQALPSDLQRQPGEVFGMFEASLFFLPDRLAPVFDAPAVAPQTPVAALAQIGAGAGAGESMGRIDRPEPRFPERDAGLEVFGFGGGPAVLRETLTGLPEMVRERDWVPAEFSVTVVASGLVGVPSVTGSSGSEEIDAFFRVFLARQFRIGERLAPGFYRVIVAR